jgi:hypothetical protein
LFFLLYFLWHIRAVYLLRSLVGCGQAASPEHQLGQEPGEELAVDLAFTDENGQPMAGLEASVLVVVPLQRLLIDEAGVR